MTRRAAVDFGSNTVGYMIGEQDASGRLKVLERDSRFVRLSEGVGEAGEISAVALERTLEWLQEVRRRFESYQVGQSRAVATEVFRRAGNGEQVARTLGEKLGVTLEVISGEEEGRITFDGVRLAYPDGPLAIIDIGGGSSEVTVDRQPVSLPIGAVNLTEAHGEQVDALRQRVDQELEALQVSSPLPDELTVLGGTGGNLGMMDLGTRELIDEQIEGHQIERNRLDELFESSAPLSPQERVDRFGLPRKRADILVAGLVILYGVLDRLGLRRVRASRHSLRHGVLRSLWNAR